MTDRTISPLRRRMSEDMTVRDLSNAIEHGARHRNGREVAGLKGGGQFGDREKGKVVHITLESRPRKSLWTRGGVKNA